MTKIHKCSMRKGEFLAIAAAGILASCTTYQYESTQERKQIVASEAAAKVGDAPDFTAFTDTRAKKQAFFDYLRPGIELENQRVKKERERLDKIQTNLQQRKVTEDDLETAKRLGKLYNLELDEGEVTQVWMDEMLHRVDVLPKALVMVQGANESAWGTSRFATKANNYFGQWCYSKGCGLVPLQRVDGMSHEVAKFSSVQQSINGYFMNVNRNAAYEALRDIRYQRHSTGQSLTDIDAAIALTNGLLKYSERGEAYVNDLQTMIRHNKPFFESQTTQQ